MLEVRRDLPNPRLLFHVLERFRRRIGPELSYAVVTQAEIYGLNQRQKTFVGQARQTREHGILIGTERFDMKTA